MKRFIETYNGRVYKLEGFLTATEIREVYPTNITANTKLDEDGKPLPVFYFEVGYENGNTFKAFYNDLDEAVQDRQQLLEELNND